MTLNQAIIVYFVCWWLLLFMALPIGIRREENPQPGMESGAPQKTHLKIKCAVVSVLAMFATWAIDIVVHSGIVAVK